MPCCSAGWHWGVLGREAALLRKPPNGFDAMSYSGRQLASESVMFADFENSQAYPERIYVCYD